MARSVHALTGGVAHMFNNLLASMIGQLELAMAELPGDSGARDDVGVALGDARKMAELCHRTISRCGTGVFRMAQVDLREVVERTVAQLMPKVPAYVTLRASPGPEAVLVAGDTHLLGIMTANLLTNALESIRADGGSVAVTARVEQVDERFLQAHVTTSTLPPGTYASIEVVDTGYGMDEIMAAKAFTPLFSTKGPGRGLGLAEVQGIALIHNGAVAFQTQLGRGSTFRILLPLAGAPTRRSDVPLPPPSAPYLPSCGTILIVDDEEGIRRYAVRILRSIGFTTYVASDGPEAIELFHEHADEIDLVLLDVFMPRMNGDKVLRALRKIRPDVRIQLMSGYQDVALSELFDKQDLATLLFKPFATTDFISNVQKAIRAK
jgi:CheY-like chemotaxis protein